MGKPVGVKPRHLDLESGSVPREVKHLSTWRKRNQYNQCFCIDGIPLVAASETGEAQTVRITLHVILTSRKL